MHTQDSSFHCQTGLRKGFALILTLSALTVIIALTAVLISYLDVARKDAGMAKALVQANLYYTDINKIFKGFKERKVLYKLLYVSSVPLLSKDGRFSVVITCKPKANGVNINWLAYGDDANMSAQYGAAQKVFDEIAQQYELEDASRLEEMLLEEIGGSKPVVLREQSRLVQKNGIISTKQFEDILDRYQREADDRKIADVPWYKFYVFNNTSKDPEENLIDGDYISAELLAILLEIDLASVQEEWFPGAIPLKTFSQNMAAQYEEKLFAKAFLPQSHCELQYDYEGERFAFGFDDIDEEIKHFEFFGKQ